MSRWPQLEPFRLGPYDVVDIRQLGLPKDAQQAAFLQMLKWTADIFRIDGRTDPRRHACDQQRTNYLCIGDEFHRAVEEPMGMWLREHPHATEAEKKRYYASIEIDDGIVDKRLCQWTLVLLDSKLPVPRKQLVGDRAFKGSLYIYNMRTLSETDREWEVSPYLMLATPVPKNYDLYLGTFAAVLRSMLDDPLEMTDGRVWKLGDWRFSQDRPWIGLDPESSPYVARIIELANQDADVKLVKEVVRGKTRRMLRERRVAVVPRMEERRGR